MGSFKILSCKLYWNIFKYFLSQVWQIFTYKTYKTNLEEIFDEQIKRIEKEENDDLLEIVKLYYNE